jgi:hypothetical protein
MKLAGYVALMGDRKNAYEIFIGKPQRKRPLGRPMRKWGDNIEWILGKLGG